MNGSEGYFKTRLSYEPSRDKIWNVIVRYLQRYIPDDASILELGAGYCSFINNVKARDKHALDISNIVRKYANKDVTVHVRDCRRLQPFDTASFDVVFSSFLYEHLSRKNLNYVMRQLRRIIKPGGILMTLLPNFKYVYRHYFDDYTHIQIFTHISFADYITSHGFEVVVNCGRFIPYSFKSRFPKSAFLTRIYLCLPWHPFAGNMLVIARNPNNPIPKYRKVRRDTEQHNASHPNVSRQGRSPQRNRIKRTLS